MLYGNEYGGPARCSHCDSRTWTTCSECYHCGAACCDNCASVREDPDSSTGYRGVELICDECQTRAVKDIVCEACLADRQDVVRFRTYDADVTCCDWSPAIHKPMATAQCGKSETVNVDAA